MALHVTFSTQDHPYLHRLVNLLNDKIGYCFFLTDKFLLTWKLPYIYMLIIIV